MGLVLQKRQERLCLTLSAMRIMEEGGRLQTLSRRALSTSQILRHLQNQPVPPERRSINVCGLGHPAYVFVTAAQTE